MGRIVIGAAIEQAFKRKKQSYSFTIVNSSRHTHLLSGIKHIEIPVENELQLSQSNYQKSIVFATLTGLKPDILLVDHMWFTLFNFITDLPCMKIYLATNTLGSFFEIQLKEETMRFNSSHYDRIIAIEPYPCPITNDHIEPIIIRNHNEILSREEACRRLMLDPGKKHCLFSLNLEENKSRELRTTYSYLEEEGYSFFHTSLFSGGIFPIADYFNAFDLVICGGGYNAFWEAVYFKKEAVFIPVPTRFDYQQWRIDNCQEYKFKRNGADELVEMILNL